MGFSFKVFFVEFRTCESREQCIGPTEKCQMQKKFSFQYNPNIHLVGKKKRDDENDSLHKFTIMSILHIV